MRSTDRGASGGGTEVAPGAPWRGGSGSHGKVGSALAWRCGLIAVAVGVASGPALAHGGSLSSAAGDAMAAPASLVAATGTLAVCASLIAGSNFSPSVEGFGSTRLRVTPPGARVVRGGGRLLGVLGLAGVVTAGLFGPADPLSNAATVVVWVGWWPGYAITTYLVGNSWPVVNPWRTLSGVLPDVGREYEWRHGAWPRVAALLALAWLEIVGPLADRPRTLAVTVLAYSAVTLAGATVYGTGTWFGSVDPIAGVFRIFGHVAPVGTDGSGRLSLRFPGEAMTDAGLVDGRDEAAFLVGILWVTTYDGLVTTPQWESVATAVAGAGVPPGVVYPLGLVAGFGLFLGVFELAVEAAWQTSAGVDRETLTGRFAPPLVAVAAATHLAHYLGYVISLTPPLIAAVTGTPVHAAPVLVVPDAVGIVGMGAVVFGHLLALGATRAVVADLYPDRSRAVRSGFPFVVATTAFTIVALWVGTRPAVAPPFL